MKKHFLFLATLVLGFGQLFADQVTFSIADLRATLPSNNTKVEVPYTWKVSPYHVSVTIAKKDGTTGTLSIANPTTLTNYTLTVTVAGAGTLDGITVTAPTGLNALEASTGTYTSGTWTPEGTTSSVTFTPTGAFRLTQIAVDYTPDGGYTPDVPTQPEARRVLNAAYWPGTEPFICDYLSGELFARNNLGKYEKWGVLASTDDLASVTTYEGKLVVLNSDNCEYKFVEGAWKNVGSVLPQEIETETNYKNMTNGEGWYCRFGYADTFNKFVYDAVTNTNTVNPYEGAGGWEPYQSKKIEGLVPGDTYKLSFKYSGNAWYSWSEGQFSVLPFYVLDVEDFGSTLYRTNPEAEVLAVESLPKAATTDKECTLQFEATKDFCVLAVQFGVCDDGKHASEEAGNDKAKNWPAPFAFTFSDIKIEKVPIVEQYVNNFKLYYEDNNAYTPLAYIENISAVRENAYTLPYIPVTTTQIDTKFLVNDKSTGWCAIFCGRNTHAGTGISLYMNGNNRANFGYFTGGTTGAGDEFAPFSLNTTYNVKADVTKLQWSTDNGETWTEKETGNTVTNPTKNALSLFANPDWDNPMRGRIYYCTISEYGSTQFEFQPVLRHDGAFGFYDKNAKLFVMPARYSLDGYSYGLLEDQSYIYYTDEPRTLFVGFTAKYEPTTQNIETTPAYTWTSSDESVATVAADGTVTGISRGTAVITATDANSDWVASYTLAVEPATVAATHVEEWDGTNDAIVGSIRWGGENANNYKPAYTVTFDSGMGYNGDYFNHVFGVPAADENGKAWYEADFVMTNVPEAVWSYNDNVLPGNWPGNMGDVYVRRYFKAEGELPAQLYMPAAHDDAPCEYYINGTKVWGRTGAEPGVNGWYENEVVKLTDEQRALIKTDGSVNVFAYHVHQNWGGRYADGGIYGNSMAENSPSKAFENDDNRKRVIIAAAQAKDVAGFPAELVEYFNSTNVGICRQDGELLGRIRWELRKLLSPRHDYDFASAEPADGLECWLYNVGAGQFLAGSNDWGTHTSLDYNISAWPMILHTNTSGESRFSIQTNLPNGIRGNNDWLGHNGYVDCGGVDLGHVNWAWTFEPVGNGNYRIINCENNGNNIYLGMTEDSRYQVDTNKAGADNLYNQWKVVTRKQLETLAAVATPEDPADVSFFIHQNTFSQNDFDGDDKGPANGDLNDSKWDRNAGSIWNWKGNDANGDYVFEMWNTGENGKVYLKQTLEGLPAGQYIVECTGYYRDGSWDDAIAGNDRKLAYIYAGSEDNCTLLPNILEGANKGAGYGRINETTIADNCRDAAHFFQYGNYTVQAPVVTVGADGKLEIGVYRDAEGVKGGDWIVVDNFRLYRVGQAVTVGDDLYATYVAPADVDFAGADVKAFAAQVNKNATGYVYLDPVTTVPAGTVVVVKAEAAGTYPVASTTGATLGTDNDLVAATADVATDGTQYILAKAEEGVGFYKATGTIAAGKGYLVIGAPVKGFYGFEADDATGINNVEFAGENAPVYNLAGQRLGKAQKGVNIIGGKKILK